MARESFNARLRDELITGGVFRALQEASVATGNERTHYIGILRLQASLGESAPRDGVEGRP